MKYQIEKPSDKDMFASKGHENSAFAIKQVIEHHDSVHVIGLEGSLGAGKSTVLKLLENNLSKDKYKFITYDVEKYHSSTKASFIKLIHKQLTSYYGTKEVLDNAKDRALGNTFSYKKKIDSGINGITVVFMLTMVFAARFIPDAVKPFFYTALDKPATGVSQTENATEVLRFSLEHNISLFFSISPLLIILFTWFVGLKGVHDFLKDKWLLNKLTKVPKFGNIIKRNGTDKITETLLVNKEVGSTELETAFTDFLTAIPGDETVILVIDNLDRVESGKVREVWSDLEIFTSLCNGKLRVIVPFSEEHIANALSSGGETNGQEFISKRLPVVFKAPPIVSAGWREPFSQFWSETLLNREGFEQCCELIDIWVTAKGKPVTPRFLKKHINDIATLVMSNVEVNPNAAVCSAYLLISKFSNLPFRYLLSTPDDTTEDNQKSIDRTKKILRKSLTNEEWASQVMCIHFQSTEDIARSELLEEPIRAAISSVESHKLFELSKLFGFKETFDKYIELNDPYDVVHSLGDLLDREDIEESERLEWIKFHLDTVNHYLVEEQHNTDITHYDNDLIFSYKKLLDNNIDINTQRIENEVQTLENHIEDEHPLNEDELLSQLHDYSYITGSTPSLIKTADAEYFFDHLWSKKGEFENWDIENIRKADKQINANIKYLETNDIVENNISYFHTLKKRNRLEQSSVAIKWGNLAKTTIGNIVNNANGYDLLPFTALWNKPQSCINLLQKINGLTNKDKDYFAWLSITICYIIQHNLTNNQYPLNAANPNVKVIAGDFIKEQAINSLDELCEYLKNDLTFISQFQKIVDALEGPHFKEIIPLGVVSAISNGKISSLNTESIATKHWDTLSNLFNDDKQKLVNWFSGWNKNIPTADKWSPRLVKDATKCGNIFFTQRIEQFVIST